MPTSDTCPHCGHQTHGPVCFNMASDNDCACTIDTRPTSENIPDHEFLPAFDDATLCRTHRARVESILAQQQLMLTLFPRRKLTGRERLHVRLVLPWQRWFDRTRERLAFKIAPWVENDYLRDDD